MFSINPSSSVLNHSQPAVSAHGHMNLCHMNIDLIQSSHCQIGSQSITNTHTHSGNHPFKLIQMCTYTHTPRRAGLPLLPQPYFFSVQMVDEGREGVCDGEGGREWAATRAWMGLQMILEFVGKKVSTLHLSPSAGHLNLSARLWSAFGFVGVYICLLASVFLGMFLSLCYVSYKAINVANISLHMSDSSWDFNLSLESSCTIHINMQVCLRLKSTAETVSSHHYEATITL